jgi:hypothetical protein
MSMQAIHWVEASAISKPSYTEVATSKNSAFTMEQVRILQICKKKIINHSRVSYFHINHKNT